MKREVIVALIIGLLIGVVAGAGLYAVAVSNASTQVDLYGVRADQTTLPETETSSWSSEDYPGASVAP